MLLRGFADGKEQVRVTHRVRGGFLASISNVALERDFFGAPGPGTVDEVVSTEENKIKEILKAVCLTKGAIDSESAATLISHMTSRVRSIRAYMEETGRVALAEIDRRFQDETSMRESILREIRKDPSSVSKELEDALQTQYGKTVLKQFKRTPAYKQMLNAAMAQVEASIMSSEFSGIADRFRGVLATFGDSMGATVFGAHSKALLAGPTPTARVKTLSAFSYEAVECDGIVLSDSIAWCVRKGSHLAPIFTLEDDIENIYMPVSSSIVLVGSSRGSRTEIPTANELQRAAFRVSDEFVVAHPSTNVDDELAIEFGTSGTVAVRRMADELRNDQR
jgi:hypothetical protein